MKRNKKILLLPFLLVLSGLACNASLPQNEPIVTHSPIVTLTPEGPGTGIAPLSEAGVPRITVEEAKAAFDAGQVIIIDVRGPESYAGSHAEGAINIPLGVFESDIENIELEKDQWIVTYCT
jgi:3-mercaptopyruvate sulfurtransferase SseA